MGLLLITHDLGVVAETCEDVAVMYAGRIVEAGPVRQIFHEPRHPYTIGLVAAMHALEAPGGSVTGPRRLREIPGAVPALGMAPAGCAFSDRCDRTEDDCRGEVPALAQAGSDAFHHVRCRHA
jgi:oligopeptide/dipeptide ABC transporter ATP-binding protein